MFRYRILLDDALGAGFEHWFEDARVTGGPGGTVLEIAVPDQAALHGILRRVHDLHLTLVSVERIDSTGPTSNRR